MMTQTITSLFQFIIQNPITSFVLGSIISILIALFKFKFTD